MGEPSHHASATMKYFAYTLQAQPFTLLQQTRHATVLIMCNELAIFIYYITTSYYKQIYYMYTLYYACILAEIRYSLFCFMNYAGYIENLPEFESIEISGITT